MNRLTEKNTRIALISNYSQTPSKEKIVEADRYNKLAELEDLEDELGCPLEVLFKALKDGVWVEVDPIDIDIDYPETMFLEEFVILVKTLDGTLCLNARDYVDELELKDYKKTWWLREDKRE